MEITVNVEDFFSKEELKDEVRFAVADEVSRSIRKWFGDSDARSIVEITARDVVQTEMQQRGIDMNKEISDAFLRELKELPYYRIFGYDEDYSTRKRTKTHAQEVLDECVDELRPEIVDKVRENFMSKIDAEDGAAIISDCFYEMMLKAIKGE